jgi:hypothetical protein
VIGTGLYVCQTCSLRGFELRVAQAVFGLVAVALVERLEGDPVGAPLVVEVGLLEPRAEEPCRAREELLADERAAWAVGGVAQALADEGAVEGRDVERV